jgi:molybdopterin converting factor small subunit
MAVKVLIPTPLRAHAGGKAAAELQAKTVAEALNHLTTEFADLKKHLFMDQEKLRSFVNIYIDDQDIRYLAQENTLFKDGDTIDIILSIAGGNVDASDMGRGATAANRSRSFPGVPQIFCKLG